MNRIQKAAIIYIAAIIFLGWGYAIGRFEVFPHTYIKKIEDYVKGHELGSKTTVVDKTINDLGLEPRRYMRTYPKVAVKKTKYVELPGVKMRREQPRVFIAPGHYEGYRTLFGAIDFENSFWGGILLSHNGDILHAWDLSTEHLATGTVHEELKNLYGLHLFPDGSIIFLQQERGGGIVKVDACSNIVWSLEGMFHHTISPTGDGDFWTYMGSQKAFDHKLAKISMETGEIRTVIDMADVRKRNPYVHIFNLQRNKSAKDISHGNDIDPLPEELALKFRQFNPGDLLMSYRTQNLIFVLDPDTLAVKWWRVGPWDRQHDPDWESDGTITVFSNNQVTPRKFSDIVSIDPNSFQDRVVVDGRKFHFYSGVNGMHQHTPFRTRMVTSTNQGWVFEVDKNNKIVFSFVNNYNSKKRKSLNMSEGLRLHESYFVEKFWEKCPN